MSNSTHNYIVPQGTKGKLIKLEKNKDAEIVDWTTRKPLSFTDCLISPIVVNEKLLSRKLKPSKLPLAERLVAEGYVLFGGESGGDREAGYVLAVPYSCLTLKKS